MLRDYRKEDFLDLAIMLFDEELELHNMGFHQKKTFVLDINGIVGFFTLDCVHDLPYLRHFCVRRDLRNVNVARFLIKAFKRIVATMGYHCVVLNSMECHNYIDLLIKYYFKVRPYASRDGHKFFLVEV